MFSPFGPAYRLFKFVPDEFVLGQKKETKDKSAWSRFGRQRRTECERRDGPSQQAALHTALILRFSPLPRVFRKGIPALAKNARHPCRAPAGDITQHFHVRRPSDAAHANRLSCRFVSPKAAMLGAV
ncbi:hypothetical protein A1356_05685 [Methylomonas koyamae]|uniref:Uncharacterized protein n=1 Tax=Methylomonas koyamae TaxID=702114 RepID=A0AA91I6G2_9GAMM|nr:hypothetical protein A1356_05685 [Methylomonas koyamae]